MSQLIAQNCIMVITLPQIAELINPGCSIQPNSHSDSSDLFLQQQLPMLVQQRLMELPIAPFRLEYPQLDQWIDQIESIAPELFAGRRKLFLDTPVRASLTVNEQQCWIEVYVNLGFRHGIPRVYEWGVRSPRFTWQDKLKLWAVSKSFELAPAKIQMSLISVGNYAQRRKYQWTRNRHRNTTEALQQLLSASHQNQSNLLTSNSPGYIKLNEIPEIVL